jgi:hypothetical protein
VTGEEDTTPLGLTVFMIFALKLYSDKNEFGGNFAHTHQ